MPKISQLEGGQKNVDQFFTRNAPDDKDGEVATLPFEVLRERMKKTHI